MSYIYYCHEKTAVAIIIRVASLASDNQGAKDYVKLS